MIRRPAAAPVIVVSCISLLLVLGASRERAATLPDLGRWADRLPRAPLLLVVPSVAAASHHLYPLLARIGLALPDLDPTRQFVELRVRLGLDPWDPSSLEAAGLDPTGPLIVVDEGPLIQPVLLLGLLPGGLARFRESVVARVAAREQLGVRRDYSAKGVQGEGLAIAEDAEPRFAYASDGAVLALAPQGCARDLAPLVAALRPRARLVQDRIWQALLDGLPNGDLLLLLDRAAMQISPWRTARRAAEDLERVASSLRVDDGRAFLHSVVRPTSEGARRVARFPVLQGAAARQVRRVGALSLWTGCSARFVLPEVLPYAEILGRTLEGQGIALKKELAALADGGAGWHLLDLEPLLPGLTEQRSVDDVSSAFFVEHALTLPLRREAQSEALLQRLDRWLANRDGQLVAGSAELPAGERSYAERGRVVGYGVVDGQLVASTGPGTLGQLRTALAAQGTEVEPDTLFALRADATALRAVLGRVGLLGAGDNTDLRAVWAARQAAAPLLARLGEIRGDLRRQGELLRFDAQVELTGSVAPPSRPPLDPRRLDTTLDVPALDPSRVPVLPSPRGTRRR
ncbi:MAG: hypothetical protein ABIJ09_10645 [Pseudomonadota bacterium]